ncbi:flagellar basal body-associated FliL family protein [Dyella lutea]|uniref:Flagellar protein FliL n=1 Tax=Dyella lutea TaxID=2950441 RepID=A0ABT1F9W4_9GAMM|nr:flagellar basal body-associated FliL family protein [Dyella lutea]MCP1374152.1 flagellar basal body-associated FliL family protein [Dyella lutea]
MDNDAPESAAIAPPKPKRGRLIILIIVALLVLGGAGAGLYAAFGPKHAPADKAAELAAEKKKPELFLPLDPAFVVNFRDDQSARYLQVGVTLMSHEQASLDVAKEAQPVIRNQLLLLFSGQSYQNLIDAAGKEKLQAQALAAVQKIMQERTGKPGIDALYFTSFVMQ